MTVGHTGEDIGEPGMGFDGVKFGGFDEGSHGCPALAAAVTACEQMVLAAERDGSDGAFDRIGIELDAAILEEPAQALPAGERIADGSASLPRAESLGSCASNQSFRASTSGRELACRITRRSSGAFPLICVSIA